MNEYDLKGWVGFATQAIRYFTGSGFLVVSTGKDLKN